jgi:hypothetical protein
MQKFFGPLCFTASVGNMYADFLLLSEHLILIQLVVIPLLQHLTFGKLKNLILSKPLTVFNRAPRLKHVVLITGFEKSVINLPWGQLIRLEAHFLYLGEYADILRNATKLVHCSLTSSNNQSHPHSDHLNTAPSSPSGSTSQRSPQ